MTKKEKAIKFSELMELATSYVAETRPKINTPSDIADIMRPILKNEEQESFYVLTCNARLIVTKIFQATKGLADRTPIHAREVFREAILQNSARVVLAHNHPTGDPSPSPEDVTTTNKLVEAGKIVGITVLDHIIIGGGEQRERSLDFISLKEEGIIAE